MTLRQLPFLPLSISPSRAKRSADPHLQRILEEHKDKIPLIHKETLYAQRRELKGQFSRIQGTSTVEYCNQPIALELARPQEGHDKGSIFSLSEQQHQIIRHVFDRQDYHSCLKLVRCVSDITMHSVVTTRFIAAGTIVCEYSGTVFLGAQLSAHAIGDSDRSYTWALLDHQDAQKSVYLCPSRKANLSRFINGVRTDEQHLANLAVRKVLDPEGRVRVVFIALHAILPNDHLFYYYGSRYATEWSATDDCDSSLHKSSLCSRSIQEFHRLSYLIEHLKWEDIN